MGVGDTPRWPFCVQPKMDVNAWRSWTDGAYLGFVTRLTGAWNGWGSIASKNRYQTIERARFCARIYAAWSSRGRLHRTNRRDSRPSTHCTHPPHGRYGTGDVDACHVAQRVSGIGITEEGVNQMEGLLDGDSNAFMRSPWRYVRATIDHRIVLFTNVSGPSVLGSERARDENRVTDDDPSQTRSDAGTRPTANGPRACSHWI